MKQSNTAKSIVLDEYLKIDDSQISDIRDKFPACDVEDLKQLFNYKELAKLLNKVIKNGSVDFICNASLRLKFSKTSLVYQRAHFLQNYFKLVEVEDIFETIEIGEKFYTDHVGIRVKLLEQTVSKIEQFALDRRIENNEYKMLTLPF